MQNLINSNEYSSIRLLSAGIRVFVRQDTQNRNTDLKCKWRIPLEGLASVLPYMDQSKILQGTIDDLEVLLADMYPLVSFAVIGLGAWLIDSFADLQAGVRIVGRDEGQVAGLPCYCLQCRNVNATWRRSVSLVGPRGIAHKADLAQPSNSYNSTHLESQGLAVAID